MIITINKRQILYTIALVLTFISITTIIKYSGKKAVTTSALAQSGEKKAVLAIIIDDFGNIESEPVDFIETKKPFTAAVMPFKEFTTTEINKLMENNIDVILHMPMEAKNAKTSWLGNYNLKTTMSDDEIVDMFNKCVEDVEGGIGINNHMGSKVMEDERILRLIMPIVKKNNLIFIDSMTTAKSKATGIAEEFGIKVYRRDVFLDGTRDVELIKKNLLKAGDVALKKGYAIAIGHVGVEGGKGTAAAIKAVAPILEEKGVYLVGIKEFVEFVEGME